MANLVPGFLFRTPGLNRNFPQIPNTATPKEKIITRVPDPDRHSRASCAANPRTHRNCYDTVSLDKKPGIHTNVHCLSSNIQRSHTWCPGQTAVNQKRHTSCQVPIDPKQFIPGMMSYTEQHHISFTLKNKMIFQYPNMPNGAKMNLCNAERIYSSRNLLEQKRKQYIQLLIQKCRGAQSMEYVKYMRYINQSKTGPLPCKTGWSRPMRLPNLVTSVDSTKDDSQKLQTPDDKRLFSFEVIQKSQSGLVGISKGETKKQIKPEQAKCESTRQAMSTDHTAHTATGIRSHTRSRLSSLTSRNAPPRSQTSSRLQESTERDKDVNSKDEPKYANFEEDQTPRYVKPVEAADEIDKMRKIPDSRPSTVLSVHEHVERPESGKNISSEVQEDQKPTNVKQEAASDEMDKMSQEHDSRPSTVLSIHGHFERPESGKSISSKDKDVETQLSINEVEEKKLKFCNKAESLVSIKSIESQQIYRAHRDTVDKGTDERASEDVHSEHSESSGEDKQREGNKEIHQARSDSEEAEDSNGETRKGSRDIYGAWRDSVESEDEKGEARSGSENISEA